MVFKHDLLYVLLFKFNLQLWSCLVGLAFEVRLLSAQKAFSFTCCLLCIYLFTYLLFICILQAEKEISLDAPNSQSQTRLKQKQGCITWSITCFLPGIALAGSRTRIRGPNTEPGADTRCRRFNCCSICISLKWECTSWREGNGDLGSCVWQIDFTIYIRMSQVLLTLWLWCRENDSV